MVGAAAPSITTAGTPPDQESMASNQGQGPAAAADNGGGSSKDITTPTSATSDHHEVEAKAAGPIGGGSGSGGHPYGVKPWGNFLTDGGGQEALRVRAGGLGPWLRALPDEVLVHSLLPCLGASDLARLSRASRAQYAFAHYSDLWKAHVLSRLAELHAAFPREQRSPEGPPLRFRGSWKETYVRIVAEEEKGETYESPGLRHRPLRVKGLYSDVLHAPYAAAAFRARLQGGAAWLARDSCPRLHRPSLQEFRQACETPNRPAVLTGVMDDWPAMEKWRTPELFAKAAQEEMRARAGKGMTLHGGGLSFTVAEYARYAAEAQHDDLPLYIFDSRFADKSPALAAHYAPFLPPYFQQSADLFSLLEPGKGSSSSSGEEKDENSPGHGRQQGRPDHRWLIWGPKGSGSTFHKDPNNTSAWNAVVRGAKKWVLFPPHVCPPGVHPSSDGLDLATPVTLAEWFEAFYSEAAKGPGFRESVVDAVVREGEVMFVPRGWWHLVLNLEESLAITQNFVSEVGLPHVLQYLDEKRHLISGLPDAERPQLYERFVSVLQARVPEVLGAAQVTRREGEEGKKEDTQQQQQQQQQRKRKEREKAGLLTAWQSVVEEGGGDKRSKQKHEEEQQGNGFSFGFSF